MAQLGSCLGDSVRTHVREFARVPEVEIPKGRWLNLPRRGRSWLTELEGPPGAQSIVLLHAVGCTGMLTWFPVVHELAKRNVSPVPSASAAYRARLANLGGLGAG